MNFKNWGIKTKLLVISFTLVIIPLLVLGVTSYSAAKKAIFAEIEEKLTMKSNQYASFIENEFSIIKGEMKRAKESANIVVEQQALMAASIIKAWPKEDSEGLKDELAKFQIGKTGYVFVMDYSGELVVSKDRARDGQNLSSEKDANGNFFARNIITTGKQLASGKVGFEVYSWKNAGEQAEREKIAGIVNIPDRKWLLCISAYYDDLVDMDMEQQAIDSFRSQLLSEKVGKTGYMFVLDGSGMIAVHPDSEGKNVFHEDYVKEICAKKTGYISYKWEGKPKVAAYTYFQEKDWIIVSGSYLADFTGPLVKIKMMIIMCAVLSCVIALFVILWFTGIITGALNKCVDLADKMGKGDFTQEIELDQTDEIGLLVNALNKMRKEISDIIKTVRDTATELHSATEQVAAASQQISDGAQQQSSSFEELSSSVQANATNSHEANDLIHDTSANAQKTGNDMLNTVEAMQQIEQSSQHIADAIAIITDIADQTNLLALNAAIEAARAGEHGKGFAVVADEVRKLAERSASSARDIEGIIKTSTRQVQDGVSLSKDAGDNLKKIVDDVMKAANQIQSISSATQEQAATMEENTSITEANAASAEELAASAEEMTSQAESLQRMVARFQTA